MLVAAAGVLSGWLTAPVRGERSTPPAPPVPPAAREESRPSEPASDLAARSSCPPADREPMVTDRPDFTESTRTVPPQRVQIESGYTFRYDRQRGRRMQDHTFPEVLLRIGLSPDVELRLGWPGFSFTEELLRERNDAGRRVWRTRHDDSGTDASVGFKVHLLDQRGVRPDLACIAELSVPTGGAGKTSGDADPQLKLAWSYDLTRALALSGNVNLGAPTGEEGRFAQTAASLSLGASLNDWLGTYVEYFGFYPDDRGADCAHYVNGGLTFAITPDLQLDARAGFGLNEQADGFFAGVGLAMRF